MQFTKDQMHIEIILEDIQTVFAIITTYFNTKLPQ